VVYALCAVTSATCALLLYRESRRVKTPLLFWTAVCFGGLTINNVLLFADLVVMPNVDLSVLRTAIALAAMSTLIFGLVWRDR
jgi:hypothetical protein